MKNVSLLLDNLLDIFENHRKGMVDVEPKFVPLMVIVKALDGSDSSEEHLKHRIEELKEELENCQKDLDRSRTVRLNLLTSADNEIRRVGIGHVSKWVQEKTKE